MRRGSRRVASILLGAALGAAPGAVASDPEDVAARVDAAFRRVIERPGGAAEPSAVPLRRVSRARARGPEATLRPQRLRLLSAANRPTRVVMALTAATRDEVRGVAEVLQAMAAEAPPAAEPELVLHLLPEHAEADLELGLEPELARFVEVDEEFPTDDVWVQDWGEVVALPGRGGEKVGVLDLARGRGLDNLGSHLADVLDAPLLRVHAATDETGDYGGNIEVTPDDMLVVGDTASDAVLDYLAAAGYGEGRRAILEVGWLDVGHVDEIFTFLPAPDTDLGYAVVQADPLLGLDLLSRMSQDEWTRAIDELVEGGMRAYPLVPDVLAEGTVPLRDLAIQLGDLRALVRGERPPGPRRPPLEAEPLDLEVPATEDLEDPGELGLDEDGELDSEEVESEPREPLDGDTLLALQLEAASHIETAALQLAAAIRARHGDVEIPLVRVPTLYRTGDSGGLVALTPEATNLVVLPGTLMVPDPLLERFRDVLTEQVRDLGYEPYFVPAMTYHLSDGQLHCGTYVVRDPTRWVHPRYQRKPLSASQPRRVARRPNSSR